MSISSVNAMGVNATPVSLHAAATTKPSPAPIEQASSSASPSVVVNISHAGKAALEEAMETKAQTQAEAAHGDRQAQRQLAKMDAYKK